MFRFWIFHSLLFKRRKLFLECFILSVQIAQQLAKASFFTKWINLLKGKPNERHGKIYILTVNWKPPIRCSNYHSRVACSPIQNCQITHHVSDVSCLNFFKNWQATQNSNCLLPMNFVDVLVPFAHINREMMEKQLMLWTGCSDQFLELLKLKFRCLRIHFNREDNKFK